MTVSELTSRMLDYNDTIVRIYTYSDNKGVELTESEDNLFSDIGKYGQRPVKMWYVSENKLNIII